MKTHFIRTTLLLFLVVLLGCGDNSQQKSTTAQNAEALKSSDDSTIVIADLSSGVPAFVADSNTLRNDWQNFISAQPDLDPCELNHIEIVSDASSPINYYLVVSGTMSGDAMKASLELKKGSATCLIVSGFTLTCQTKDCSSEAYGCFPAGTACNPCANKGKCTKTITSTPVNIFPSVPTGNCPN